MKKQILASILVGALAVSSASASSLFGGDREKPNYDYSADKKLIEINTRPISTDNAKYWCFDKGNDLGCLSLEKLEALESKDLKKVVKFYEKTIPEYCYDKKFAPACNIPAIDLIQQKLSYYVRNDIDNKTIKTFYSDYAKALSESKADVKMLEYGCNELKSAYICRDLRDMYKYLGDKEKTKEYNDKMKNGDEKWNSVLYDYKHMRYIHGGYSSWWLLEKIK